MADRVKYFVLGLLFLVVAGVIAYDNWNSKGTPDQVVADAGDADRVDIDVGIDPSNGGDLSIAEQPPVDPGPARPEVQPHREPPVNRDLQAESARNAGTKTREEPKPAPVEVKPPAPEPERTHVVKSGESLEAIAIKYYGTRRGIGWIVERNGLANPNRIFAKQKLIIPARKELKAAPASRTARRPAETTPGEIPSRYVVKSGEDLYEICRRYYGSKGLGPRVDRVMDLNQLWTADVKPGAVLILPPK